MNMNMLIETILVINMLIETILVVNTVGHSLKVKFFGSQVKLFQYRPHVRSSNIVVGRWQSWLLAFIAAWEASWMQ